MPETRQVLFYEYVADIVQRREAFRADHLAAIRAAKEDGRILLAGALGDPPHGGALVFSEQSAAEAFAQSDPYVINGLVTSWHVEPWTLV